MADFRLTARFLQPWSHGRGEDGGPEWPPSPLRLFQALVASSIGRAVDLDDRERFLAALKWLERQRSPEILAPRARRTMGYRTFVPDNTGDQVGRAWSKGNEGNLADYRTEKDVRALTLSAAAPALPAVHYLFRNADPSAHFATLRRMARSLTHLGWGVDQVAGDAGDVLIQLEGERWLPGRRGAVTLRRPVEGTLEALEKRHQQFLERIEGDLFRPVSPLSVFDRERYARAGDAEPRAFAAFRIVQPTTGDRLSFDPARRARDVAAWVRHAIEEVTQGWPFGDTRTLIHGHLDAGGGPRFSYQPLATINPKLGRAEGIARVAVVAPEGHEAQLEWIRMRLAGAELTWKGEAMGSLEPLAESDWVLAQYMGTSHSWSTVTPVILPGHDDRSTAKAERLLLKAFLQSGMTPEQVESIQELDWQKAPFRAGTQHAAQYLPPDGVKGPMFHVRLRFDQPFSGPLLVGSGRHRGVGVFAAC